MFEDHLLSANNGNQRASNQLSAPLLCWDVAHPLLRKRQEMVNDLETFAQLKARFDWQNAVDLRSALLDNLTVIVTDRAARILWVSDAFHLLTGYQSSEAVGKTPAFLQGPLTSPKSQRTIRQHLVQAQPVAVKVLNYRKEGTPYWCQVDIHPLINSQQECTHFIAYEKELAA